MEMATYSDFDGCVVLWENAFTHREYIDICLRVISDEHITVSSGR